MEPSNYFILAIIAIGVWLLVRPVLIWYCKIDRAIELLEHIAASLDKSEDPANKDTTITGPTWICQNCGQKNPIGVVKCLHCATAKP